MKTFKKGDIVRWEKDNDLAIVVGPSPHAREDVLVLWLTGEWAGERTTPSCKHLVSVATRQKK